MVVALRMCELRLQGTVHVVGLRSTIDQCGSSSKDVRA